MNRQFLCGGAVAFFTSNCVPLAAQAEDISISQLVEMFIQLGIIAPEKVGAARAAVANLNIQPVAKPAVSFTRPLELGDREKNVCLLQKVLNQNAITQIASTGAGSPGNKTVYFGAGTRVAVIKFQESHAAEVLVPAGLARGTGYVGGRTIAKLNALIAGGAPGTAPGATSVISAPATTSAPSAPSCQLTHGAARSGQRARRTDAKIAHVI